MSAERDFGEIVRVFDISPGDVEQLRKLAGMMGDDMRQWVLAQVRQEVSELPWYAHRQLTPEVEDALWAWAGTYLDALLQGEGLEDLYRDMAGQATVASSFEVRSTELFQAFNKLEAVFTGLVLNLFAESDEQAIMLTTLAKFIRSLMYVVMETYRLLSIARLEKTLHRLREAQDQIIAQQKLAYLGTLTAGIAHEIKNPLNFVNNFSLLSLSAAADLRAALTNYGASRSEDDRAEVQDCLEMLELNARKIHEHGSRADRVVESMLLHAGTSSGQLEETDLGELVLQSVELARSGAHGTLQVTVELDQALPRVRMAPRDVARALLNIIGNAVRAVADRATQEGPGFVPRVVVSTGRQDGVVVVRVRDNGRGIAADVREHIFTPFFTTRPTGEGTGLGLSISHDIIVSQHKGRLLVDSQPGEYAEFIIELPMSG